MFSSSKTPQPPRSVRDAGIREWTVVAAAGRMERATDPIEDYQSTHAVDSTTIGSHFPLTTKTTPQNSLPMALRRSDASPKPACSPHSYPQGTTYTPSPSPVKSRRVPSQLVQEKERNDDGDHPLMLPVHGSYLESSRVGLKLYCGDDDDSIGMGRDGEGIERISFDDSDQWDEPYMPGPEAENRRHCLTWLRNVPQPRSFQAQDAPSKRK